MKDKDDKLYLYHIIDAIKTIEKYKERFSEEGFRSDNLVQDGIIRQIEIIGEASKRLSPVLRKKYNHIPWKDITGMRDKLIHDYFGVDIEAVWETVCKDIPELKKEIEQILKK